MSGEIQVKRITTISRTSTVIKNVKIETRKPIKNIKNGISQRDQVTTSVAMPPIRKPPVARFSTMLVAGSRTVTRVVLALTELAKLWNMS